MSTLFEETHRLHQIRKLTESSRAIGNAATMDEVFQQTADRSADLLDADQALVLVASSAGILTLQASRGVDRAKIPEINEPLNEGLVKRLAELCGVRPESFFGVPMVVDGRIRGLLVVIRHDNIPGVPEDEWLLSALADQTAIAMERMRLSEMAAFREQLIGIVGHDLRDPLNTIVMAAKVLLMREGLGEMETGLAKRITTSASRATRLIDQLLDLTRSRLGGGIPVDPVRFDMNEIFRQVIGDTQITHPDRPLRVEMQGDAVGRWDRDRIAQLLGNLMGNAVKHGGQGSPIELRFDGRGVSEVVFEVGSHGNPIPASLLPFIFDAFRQGRTERFARKRGLGLGLGLFISREIARAHGGSITAVSSEIDGTIFRVRLPRGPAPAAE